MAKSVIPRRTKRLTAKFWVALSLTWLLASKCLLPADTVVLIPVADTSLREMEPDPPSANGSAADLIAGIQGPAAFFARNRALIKFDLASSIPAFSHITEARLTLTVTKSADNTNAFQNFDLRRVLTLWREADATWNIRLLPDTAWSAPGGAMKTDFAAIVSASQAIDGTNTNPYTFLSTSNLVADVQSWLDHPPANFGWVLLAQQEGIPQSARRIASRENTVSPPLMLAVSYIPPPRIAGFQLANGQFSLRFNAEPLYDYVVEFRDSLSSGNWAALTNFTAKVAAFEATASDSLSASPQRFYRVTKTPCGCK